MIYILGKRNGKCRILEVKKVEILNTWRQTWTVRGWLRTNRRKSWHFWSTRTFWSASVHVQPKLRPDVRASTVWWQSRVACSKFALYSTAVLFDSNTWPVGFCPPAMKLRNSAFETTESKPLRRLHFELSIQAQAWYSPCVPAQSAHIPNY